MNRSTPLITGETYHIYNRGAHKNEIFSDSADYNRLLLLLYLSNRDKPVNLRNLLEKHKGLTFVRLLELEGPGTPLVDLFAYALMPNHFHFVIRQKVDGGISAFMQKICTAYSMYYNLKHQHSGTLFQGRFKSSHINTEPYFRWIFAYVHLNPLELAEPDWKEGNIRNSKAARKFLAEYRYGSYSDYCVGERPERAILAYNDAPDFLKTQNDLEEALGDFERGRVLHAEDIGNSTKVRPLQNL
ncbi:MAG: transposase [Patescibacteria group bacterium]